jgi:hypothetical protein
MQLLRSAHWVLIAEFTTCKHSAAVIDGPVTVTGLGKLVWAGPINAGCIRFADIGDPIVSIAKMAMNLLILS